MTALGLTVYFFFFFYCSGAHRDLHSFPTRRSSDLIGINPATDSVPAVCALLDMLDGVIQKYEIPTQS